MSTISFVIEMGIVMDFQRIDDNTVQCRMTEEEMNEYGFKIEDFFTNQEKSREFLEQIVERAEEEVGYEVESGMVSMQLMRMPDNSLTITFTDQKEEGLQAMLGHIQNLVGMIDESAMEELMDRLKSQFSGNSHNDEYIHDSENIEKFEEEHAVTEETSEYRKRMKEIEKKNRQKQKERLSAARVYEFASLHDLECFAASVQCEKNISSKVYKDNLNGSFYLLVRKGKLKLDEYQMLCEQLCEYARLCSSQQYAEQYCKEHFECLISKHAIKVLQEY